MLLFMNPDTQRNTRLGLRGGGEGHPPLLHWRSYMYYISMPSHILEFPPYVFYGSSPGRILHKQYNVANYRVYSHNYTKDVHHCCVLVNACLCSICTYREKLCVCLCLYLCVCAHTCMTVREYTFICGYRHKIVLKINRRKLLLLNAVC